MSSSRESTGEVDAREAMIGTIELLIENRERLEAMKENVEECSNEYMKAFEKSALGGFRDAIRIMKEKGGKPSSVVFDMECPRVMKCLEHVRPNCSAFAGFVKKASEAVFGDESEVEVIWTARKRGEHTDTVTSLNSSTAKHVLRLNREVVRFSDEGFEKCNARVTLFKDFELDADTRV